MSTTNPIILSSSPKDFYLNADRFYSVDNDAANVCRPVSQQYDHDCCLKISCEDDYSELRQDLANIVDRKIHIKSPIINSDVIQFADWCFSFGLATHYDKNNCQEKTWSYSKLILNLILSENTEKIKTEKVINRLQKQYSSDSKMQQGTRGTSRYVKVSSSSSSEFGEEFQTSFSVQTKCG